MEEKEENGMEDRRPTPVRMAMEGAEPQAKEEGSEIRALTDPDTGEEWTVHISGRSASGILPLRVISLVELAFTKAADPEKPLRKAVCRGESLQDFWEEDLLRILGESRPFEIADASTGDSRRKTGKGRSRQSPGG